MTTTVLNTIVMVTNDDDDDDDDEDDDDDDDDDDDCAADGDDDDCRRRRRQCPMPSSSPGAKARALHLRESARVRTPGDHLGRSPVRSLSLSEASWAVFGPYWALWDTLVRLEGFFSLTGRFLGPSRLVLGLSCFCGIHAAVPGSAQERAGLPGIVWNLASEPLEYGGTRDSGRRILGLLGTPHFVPGGGVADSVGGGGAKSRRNEKNVE